MKVSPKKIIECRFGVTLYPTKVYEVIAHAGGQMELHIGRYLSVICDRKNLNIITP